MSSSTVTGPKTPLIEFRNVTVAQGERVILDHFNLSIGSKECVAILGPNGAGKSSLIKTITRELYPLADEDSFVRILGKERWDVSELRSHLGIVSNGANKIEERITCREMVLSGFFGTIGLWQNDLITQEMEDKTDEVLGLLGISGLASRDISQISTGESRLTLIGRALVNDPPTLLLDEPTLSLDPKAAWDLRRKLSKMAGLGKNIIIVTHDLSDIVPEIQRIILIRNGTILNDGDKSRVLTSKYITKLFDIDLHVFRRDRYYYLG